MTPSKRAPGTRRQGDSPLGTHGPAVEQPAATAAEHVPTCDVEPKPKAETPTTLHTPNEQALVDRYTEIAQLAGALAHEIKNPLSTIRLNMELLSEEFAEAENPRERRVLAKIQTVERECQRLQDLLDDFLSFAKVRASRRQPSDLNQEVARLFDFFRPQATDTGIELVTYFDPDLPSVSLDREVFRAALFNLVLNAQQAMPGGGQLVARTRRHNGGVELDLIDTGSGMDERTVSRIFDAFYSTKQGGSGLGLPTARKIVVAHGGTIHVESAPGKGTKFTIQLPVG
ncbi:MAG: sensor histidine kinase [Pirellulales bacterium]|nr:sensor histidine kinase [Pirellulales bacterium]